jgi:hypothetical protein
MSQIERDFHRNRLRRRAQNSKPNPATMGVLVTILVVGTLLIAVADPLYRQPFFSLAQVGLGGYCGWIIPRR